MNAPRKKSEGLNHAFDVRVFAFVRFEQETPGNLRVFIGELCAHLPNEAKLAFVIAKQFVAHYSPRTRYWPLESCSIASKVTGSGAGSILKRASMRKCSERCKS